MPEIEGETLAVAPGGSWPRVVVEALVVVVLAVVVSLGINAVRSEGLALVQAEAYDILVPCSDAVGDAQGLDAGSSLISEPSSLIVDVRLESEFAAWHLPGAHSQPFDWLGPPVDAEVEEVARQIAASRAQRVVVYGDGDDPDSGREWARLLSGARIKHVFFVEGGAPALGHGATP